MATYRLKPEHPVSKKIDKLFAFLEQEGLTISHSYDGLRISDSETGRNYEIKDIEAEFSDGNLCDYPAQFEYKIVFEKEEE